MGEKSGREGLGCWRLGGQAEYPSAPVGGRVFESLWVELGVGELVNGVPILAWEMGAEQPLNAKLVAMGLKAGLVVSDEKLTTIDRRVICDGVKELMGGEKGRRATERATELGTMARRGVPWRKMERPMRNSMN